MGIELTWYGHGTWMIATGKHRIVIDPFFDNNPSSPIKAADVEADFILVSHGHFDHIDDAAPIANRTGAQVVTNYEIATWLNEKHAVEKTVGMNLGGAVNLEFGTVKMVPAWHSSGLPDGSYGGEPAGFLIKIDDKKLYFACDTALFSDMKMIGAAGLDLAVVPIGDMFTMGPADSVTAASFLEAKQVVPAHYGTWPPIEQDADAWADSIRAKTKSEPVVMQPGQTHVIAS